MSKYDYKKLLSTRRERSSTIERPEIIDEFYSDRSRIIYSSSFRRLQQKAQVFSLEPNSNVRTRLTHSIEVADLGRTLANKIGAELCKKKWIKEKDVPSIVAIVENSCLLHDIGNPPFGHFGEAAIKEWAKNEISEIAAKADIERNELFNNLIEDFIEFDGNPQGIRIITKLHCEQDEFSLNLTYSTLMCGIKYPRLAGEKEGVGTYKKAGYFQSEKEKIEKIYQEMGIESGKRYPLTYIMEAADDIAYCLSDISDGIEKNIIKPNDFKEEFINEWKKTYPDDDCPVEMPSDIKYFNLDLSVKWAKIILESAAEEYIKNHEKIYSGEATQLINENEMGKVLKIIKNVSRKLLYSSPDAERIELVGYSVITGLLNKFSRLLELPASKFISLVEGEQKDLDLELRLFHRLGKRYVDCYNYERNKLEEDENYKIKEWWLRTHLIIDHITGMTDDYALATYQMLHGITY